MEQQCRKITKLGQIAGMKRYLEEDCPFPYSIFDIRDFNLREFETDTACELLVKTDDIVVVRVRDVIVIFWRDTPMYPKRIRTANWMTLSTLKTLKQALDDALKAIEE